jgi:hypothetical protein
VAKLGDDQWSQLLTFTTGGKSSVVKQTAIRPGTVVVLVLQPEILRVGDGWRGAVVGPGLESGWQRVAAAAVVADLGSGLVEASPQLAGGDRFGGVAGVEVDRGQAVPDGVDRGPQQWPGDQPVASLSMVIWAFPCSVPFPVSASGAVAGSGSGKTARWTARNAVASMQVVR